MRGVYGGGPFYPGPDQAAIVADVTGSGLNTVIAWCIHVAANGDLAYNDTAVVQGGAYIGDPSWGDLLASLKSGSVDRILLSVGSGGVSDFTHIGALLSTSSGTAALTASFQALREALPAVDGIDLDDEDNLDAGVIANFSRLVASVGFGEVTFCPYMEQDVWRDALLSLNESNPGLVTAYNLQCYSGGYGNDPNQWAGYIDHAVPVYPGLNVADPSLGCEGLCPPEVTSALDGYSPAVPGAWLWLYDAILKGVSQCCGGEGTTAAYNAAIVKAIGS